MSKILAPYFFFQKLPCITFGYKLYQIAREEGILNLPLLLLSNGDTSPSTGASLEGPNTISLLSRCRRDHIFCTEWHAEIFSIRPSFVPKGAMKECEAGGGANLLHSDCWAFILGLFRKLPHSDKCDVFDMRVKASFFVHLSKKKAEGWKVVLRAVCQKLCTLSSNEFLGAILSRMMEVSCWQICEKSRWCVKKRVMLHLYEEGYIRRKSSKRLLIASY